MLALIDDFADYEYAEAVRQAAAEEKLMAEENLKTEAGRRAALRHLNALLDHDGYKNPAAVRERDRLRSLRRNEALLGRPKAVKAAPVVDNANHKRQRKNPGGRSSAKSGNSGSGGEEEPPDPDPDDAIIADLHRDDAQASGYETETTRYARKAIVGFRLTQETGGRDKRVEHAAYVYMRITRLRLAAWILRRNGPCVNATDADAVALKVLFVAAEKHDLGEQPAVRLTELAKPHLKTGKATHYAMYGDFPGYKPPKQNKKEARVYSPLDALAAGTTYHHAAGDDDAWDAADAWLAAQAAIDPDTVGVVDLKAEQTDKKNEPTEEEKVRSFFYAPTHKVKTEQRKLKDYLDPPAILEKIEEEQGEEKDDEPPTMPKLSEVVAAAVADPAHVVAIAAALRELTVCGDNALADSLRKKAKKAADEECPDADAVAAIKLYNAYLLTGRERNPKLLPVPAEPAAECAAGNTHSPEGNNILAFPDALARAARRKPFNPEADVPGLLPMPGQVPLVLRAVAGNAVAKQSAAPQQLVFASLDTSGDRLIDVVEVAHLLGLSPGTVRNRLSRSPDRVPPPARTPGRERRWRHSEVMRWLDRLSAGPGDVVAFSTPGSGRSRRGRPRKPAP